MKTGTSVGSRHRGHASSARGRKRGRGDA
jgi:hypothetical protein